MFPARDVEGIVIRVAGVDLSTVGEQVSAENAQHRSQASRVIAVWVRQHDCVEMVDAVPNEKGCDDALADRFGRRAGGERRTALEPTAGVDQDRVTARRLNQQRVGLADVERRYDEIVRARARGPE